MDVVRGRVTRLLKPNLLEVGWHEQASAGADSRADGQGRQRTLQEIHVRRRRSIMRRSQVFPGLPAPRAARSAPDKAPPGPSPGHLSNLPAANTSDSLRLPIHAAGELLVNSPSTRLSRDQGSPLRHFKRKSWARRSQTPRESVGDSGSIVARV